MRRRLWPPFRPTSGYNTIACRAQHLEKLDQGQMMAIRDAWFSQGKGAPPGNKCEGNTT